MPLVNKRLTEREKAAVYMNVFGGCDDWRLLYAIADNTPEKAPADIDRSVASRWKNSPKIRALIDELNRVKLQMIVNAEKAGAEKARAEQEAGNSERAKAAPENARTKFVDYSSPAAQQAKLNELVNTASDPGEALDALKVIIQGQKADREAAKEGRVQRVYLPISCESCPLYQNARKKGEK